MQAYSQTPQSRQAENQSQHQPGTRRSAPKAWPIQFQHPDDATSRKAKYRCKLKARIWNVWTYIGPKATEAQVAQLLGLPRRTVRWGMALLKHQGFAKNKHKHGLGGPMEVQFRESCRTITLESCRVNALKRNSLKRAEAEKGLSQRPAPAAITLSEQPKPKPKTRFERYVAKYGWDVIRKERQKAQIDQLQVEWRIADREQRLQDGEELDEYDDYGQELLEARKPTMTPLDDISAYRLSCIDPFRHARLRPELEKLNAKLVADYDCNSELLYQEVDEQDGTDQSAHHIRLLRGRLTAIRGAARRQLLSSGRVVQSPAGYYSLAEER
jgi:hypothetical protein